MRWRDGTMELGESGECGFNMDVQEVLDSWMEWGTALRAILDEELCILDDGLRIMDYLSEYEHSKFRIMREGVRLKVESRSGGFAAFGTRCG